MRHEGVRIEAMGRSHRVRRPKNARIVDANIKRGHINNGLIEVATDSEDDIEIEDLDDGDGYVTRLPAHGIKLDFIAKAKR